MSHWDSRRHNSHRRNMVSPSNELLFCQKEKSQCFSRLISLRRYAVPQFWPCETAQPVCTRRVDERVVPADEHVLTISSCRPLRTLE